MIKIILIFFVLITNLSYSKVTLKIHEPMRFEILNITNMSDVVVGKGIIEIYTDDIENDYGKKLVFKFPEKGLLTNKKRWLRIEKYMMEDKDKNVIIENERLLVPIYAIIDRNMLNDGKMEAKYLEGEYVGQIPIVVSEYTKILGKVELETKEGK